MELTGYLAILRRWWSTLLVAVWVAAVLGFPCSARRIEPTYEASVRLLVGPINTDTNTLRASGPAGADLRRAGDEPAAPRSTVAELGLSPMPHPTWRAAFARRRTTRPGS